MRFSDDHLMKLRSEHGGTLVHELVQYIFNLRQSLRTAVFSSKDWSRGYFLDLAGKKIDVGRLGICRLCSNMTCNCDADEEGFYMCDNHKLHPLIKDDSPNVHCTMSRLQKKFPGISYDEMCDIVGDADAFTYADAVKVLTEEST